MLDAASYLVARNFAADVRTFVGLQTLSMTASLQAIEVLRPGNPWRERIEKDKDIGK